VRAACKAFPRFLGVRLEGREERGEEEKVYPWKQETISRSLTTMR
jgi:hypothetical protein